MFVLALVVLFIIFGVLFSIRIISGSYSLGVVSAGGLESLAQSSKRLVEWQDQVGLKHWRQLTYAVYAIAFPVGWFAGWWIALYVFMALSGVLGLLYPYMRWRGYKNNRAADESTKALARLARSCTHRLGRPEHDPPSVRHSRDTDMNEAPPDVGDVRYR
jgi:hypothetical protein